MRDWGLGTRDWGTIARNRTFMTTSLDYEQESLFEILACSQKLILTNNNPSLLSPVPCPQPVELSEQEIANLLPVTCCLLPDLQWFSDSDDEDAPGRTEQPTDTKLRRLREEEGEVPKSQELNAALGLLLPSLTILFLAPYMFRTCVELLRFFYMRVTELDPVNGALIADVFVRRYLPMLALPVLSVAFVTAIASNVLQTGGFIFTAKKLSPKLSRAVPRLGKFFKRMFSIDGFYNMGKSLIKMLIIGGVSYFIIMSKIDELRNLQLADPWTGFTTIAGLAIQMLLMAAVLLLILSIPDYLFQRWRFRQRNKMTRYEIKEELKMQESDPQIQSRIRRRFQELLRQNFAQEVPKADVVITNPTHYSVAIMYDRNLVVDGISGPIVLAKGDDELALRIRTIARRFEVPIVENRPLAKALFENAQIGQFIDVQYWEAIAKIIISVSKLNEERKRKRRPA